MLYKIVCISLKIISATCLPAAKLTLEDIGLSKVVSTDLVNSIIEVMAEEMIAVLNSGLKGVIQIDNSKFGHQITYGKGSRFDDGIWVFGLIEADKSTCRQTDNLLVFPVQY